MKNIILFSLVVFSANSFSHDYYKVWELELKTQEEKRRLVIKLTDESSDSCIIGSPKVVRTLEGKMREKSKHFSGYSYSINNNVLSIDMFPALCDGGDVLRGKIEGDNIKGEILSSSIAGFRKVGTFKGKAVVQKP
ncbi:hypothetical protein [Aliikangiella sp. IMCC44632]